MFLRPVEVELEIETAEVIDVHVVDGRSAGCYRVAVG